jgi:hypothetical protein
MEVDDRCSFSILPKDASEALLQQAWQHLDQQHRFGIIPRVCSTWFHLSLPTFTSLELTLRDQGSMQQFAAWLRHHGSNLQHLSVRKKMQLSEPSCPLLLEVLGSINSCDSLTSLHLVCWNGPITLSEQLLTRLSSLSVRDYKGGTFNIGQLSRMRQLKALDLSGSRVGIELDEFEVHQLLSALPNLTSLDLTHSWLPLKHLASCPNLPPLQELKLSITPSLFTDRFFDLAYLPVLPCTSLHVDVCGPAPMEDFKTWSAGQQAKSCLGKLTSMHWYKRGSLSSSSAQPMSHDIVSCMADAAGQLRRLTLTGFNIASLKDLALLTGLTQLTSLTLGYAGPPDADVVTPLAALSILQQLTVAGLSECQADAVRAAVAAGHLPWLKEVEVVASLMIDESGGLIVDV